jgi:hypothetical protein
MVMAALVAHAAMLVTPVRRVTRAIPVTTGQAALVGRKATLVIPEVLATPVPQVAVVAVVAALAVIRG